jgi:cell division protein FtsL
MAKTQTRTRATEKRGIATERGKLTAERKRLDYDYSTLKNEVKEAEQIRKSIYSILRQEQRERQPHRAKDIDR